MNNMLPIGFVHEGQAYRSFEVNKVDGFMERIIHNETLRKERPQTWMAMVLSGLLKSIEGDAISYDFVESGGKKIPELVKRIPLADAGLVLIAGHVSTYGAVLKGQKARCTVCTHANTLDIDLATLKMPEITDEVIETMKVQLQTGWQRVVDPSKAGQKELGWEDEVFDVFEFGIPTVGDALRNEKHYVACRVLDFQLKIVNDRLKSVKASKDGFVMPQDMFEAYKSASAFFADRNGLFGNDRTLIRDAMNKLPQVNMTVTVMCDSCMADFEAGVSYGSFFPLVS